MNALPIYYGDTLAGMFYRTDGNVYCLDYEPEWQEGGFALSVHLPLETCRFPQAALRVGQCYQCPA